MLEELVGCIIITRYNDKTYRIDDVAFNLNPNCPWNDEQETYAQYYKRRYGMTIQNPTQPLLVSRLKVCSLKPLRRKISSQLFSKRSLEIKNFMRVCCFEEALFENSELFNFLSQGLNPGKFLICLFFNLKFTCSYSNFGGFKFVNFLVLNFKFVSPLLFIFIPRIFIILKNCVCARDFQFLFSVQINMSIFEFEAFLFENS